MQTAPKKVVNAWAMYDWANSVFNLVITTTFFPIYYLGVTGDGNEATKTDYIDFLWLKHVPNSSLYNYTMATGFLIVAIMSPILSSIADYKGNKKSFMRFLLTLGSLSCMGFYFFRSDTLLLGTILMITATVGYWSSLVFYNSYLPEIAAPQDRDRISARGFMYGYIGSVLLQIIGFVLVMLAGDDEAAQSNAVRITFVLVGIWWLSFAQITLKNMPAGKPSGDGQNKNLLRNGFKELGKRWTPILNHFEDCGVDVCYEVHPGEDIFDGVTYEMFLETVNNHPRACLLYDPSHFVLQQLDYIQYIDHYHERIRAFHVKDAEFNKTGKQGTFGGYQSWANRAGRYRSPGDGQVDFKTIFSKLAQYDYSGWAVMEWECVIKHPEDGAREGAAFISDHIIRVTERAFDDFASSGADEKTNRRILGLD